MNTTELYRILQEDIQRRGPADIVVDMASMTFQKMKRMLKTR
jgi:hypothetical protein